MKIKLSSALFVFLVSFLLIQTDLTQAAPANGPEKLPDFKLKSTDGKLVGPADFKDKIVIINFWATWCPPCRKEIPAFVKFQKEHPDVIILAINLDRETDKVAPFVREYGINFPVLYGNNDIVSIFGGVNLIPQTYVYSKDKKLLQKYNGMVTEKDLKDLFKDLQK